MTENENLIIHAKSAMEKAYTPYSGFKVGAALLTEEGEIYTGCNIENLSYGATVCAERTAIFKAVSEGKTVFKKLAVVSSQGDKTFPCGICRQVMQEFMPNGEIIVSDDNSIAIYKVSELLPHSFNSEF